MNQTPGGPQDPTAERDATARAQRERREAAHRTQELIEEMERRSLSQFADDRRTRSFPEYLADLAEHPAPLTRFVPRYLADMVDHYGFDEVRGIGVEHRRPRLFDALPQGRVNPLVGQEHVLEAIVGIMRSFALAQRADKLIVLHGPNGSAKSTIVSLLMDALEGYSATAEGAVYRFNWVFPAHDDSSPASVGFVSSSPGSPLDDLGRDTYAHLHPEDIASRLVCELKDEPYLLLPRAQREHFFASVLADREARAAGDEAALARAADLRLHLLSDEMLGRDLCPKCKEIFDALLASYRGDLSKLWRHVQVERFQFSRRFRNGAVVVEPQLQNVDAYARQITADQSLQFLPAALQNLRLFEPGGDLVEANRGILEYADLLKRPREAYKYLLVTSEHGTLNLPNLIAYLDLLLLATVNELHLDEFKNLEANPDYVSFKARMEFVTVPYLLRASQEEHIYRAQMVPIGRDMHVAPHAERLASLWAILTRLRRPDPERYPVGLRPLLARLDPLSKAHLYDGTAKEPDRFSGEEWRTLLGAAPTIGKEHAEHDHYEGRFGVSAREMKSVLQDASQRTSAPCVTVSDVIVELKELCTRTSTHLFLRVPKEKLGYCDPIASIDVVEAEYMRWVAAEVRSAMGLASPEECERLFDQYVEHAMASSTGQKVRNARTGATEDPDEGLMSRVEGIFGIQESPEEFRRRLGGQIGAYALGHPHEKIVYAEVFPRFMDAIERDAHKGQKALAERIQRGILVHGRDEFRDLPVRDQARVETTLEALRARFGYCDHCAREAISLLIEHQRTAGGTDATA